MKTIKGLLGAKIKETRKAKGLSQAKLSEKIGINDKHLSRIEVGGSFPSLGVLEKMAKVLNVELKEFFEFTHETDTPKELKKNLNRLMEEADTNKLKVAVKVLRAIVGTHAFLIF